MNNLSLSPPPPENVCRCLLHEYNKSLQSLIALNVKYHENTDKAERQKIENSMIFGVRQLVQIAEMLSNANRHFTIEELKQDPKYDGHEPTCKELSDHYTGHDGEKDGMNRFRKKWEKIWELIDGEENTQRAFSFFCKIPTCAEKLLCFIQTGKLDEYWASHSEDLQT